MSKLKKIISIFILLYVCVQFLYAESNQVDTGEHSINQAPLSLLLNSLKAFEMMRQDNGVYADAIKFEPPQYHPCSVAAVGMGLVTLCIGDKINYYHDAEKQIILTLKTMTGKTTGFDPARNKVNGFFRHWIELDTGARAWNSEFSSIDTGILVAGALFAKKCFPENSEIAALANELYLSINWDDAIKNPTTGEIFMVFNDGGVGSLPTRPFNEYMIVAWLAKNDVRNNARAQALWATHYETTTKIPKSFSNGFELLTDSAGHFLSNFVIQFPYYLCHHFTTSNDYLAYLENAMKADQKWWEDKTRPGEYVWGTGAGPCFNGYCADNFNSNSNLISSPHIISGFIPVDPTCVSDLEQLQSYQPAIYNLPNIMKTPVLWRFSTKNESWRADAAAGVDFSTMVFGLAAHPDVLGTEFFRTNNNFDFPNSPDKVQQDESSLLYEFQLKENYPNPFNPTTTIEYTLPQANFVTISLYNTKGERVETLAQAQQNAGTHRLTFEANGLSSGVYFYKMETTEWVATRKMMLMR